MKDLTTKKITLTALFAALVFIFSAFFQIPILTPLGQTRFHLGNVFCIMAGILLSPGYGGLAAGLGSVLFDLSNPIYFSSAPFTFINKFLMGFVAGIVYRKLFTNKKHIRSFVAGALGQLCYIILYLSNSYIKNRFFMKLSMAATMAEIAEKATVSLFNGLISVIIATILVATFKNRIKFEQ